MNHPDCRSRINACTHLEPVLQPRQPTPVVSRRGGAGGGGSVRDGGGHINNYPWRCGVGKTRRRASGVEGEGWTTEERKRMRGQEKAEERERERDEAGGNGAGKSGWKKRRRGGGDAGRGRGRRGGGKRSLGSTGVKSRHQTQAALPPSFDPSLPLIQTTLPHCLPPSPPSHPLAFHPLASACSSTLTSRARLPSYASYPNLRCASTFASF